MGIRGIESLTDNTEPDVVYNQPKGDFDQEFEDRKARELAAEHEEHVRRFNTNKEA